MDIEGLPFSDDDDMEDSEKRRLFIQWLRGVLHSFLQNRDLIEQDELRTLGQRALAEIDRSSQFEYAAELAAQIPFYLVLSHGLGGIQLAFKLAAIRYWISQAINAQARTNIGRRIARRLISLIDTLLDSILDAIGAGTAIKELKKAIGDSINDAVNDAH